MARHKGRSTGKRKHRIAEMGPDPPLKMPKIADQARPETPADQPADVFRIGRVNV